jgi:hypothetical protein
MHGSAVAIRYSITSSAVARTLGGTVRPERFGGPEIDHQLELSRKLRRQIARLGAAQDAAHKGRRLPHVFGVARPIGRT